MIICLIDMAYETKPAPKSVCVRVTAWTSAKLLYFSVFSFTQVRLWIKSSSNNNNNISQVELCTVGNV